MKRTKRRLSAAALVLLLVTGSIWGGAGAARESVSAATQTTIASLTYKLGSLSTDGEGASDRTLNKTKYGSKANGYAFTTGSAKLYASVNGSTLRKLEWSTDTYGCSAASDESEPVMTAGKKFSWPSSGNPYFEVQVSTSGYEDVTFTAYVGATKKGPKNYHLAYAVGSSTSFTKISGASISLSDNKVMTKLSGTLPSAADNQSTVKIRVVVSDLTACNGNQLSADPTSGEAAINHITIAGTKQSSSTSGSSTDSSTSGSSSSSSSTSSSTSGSSSSNSSSSSSSSSGSSSSDSSSSADSSEGSTAASGTGAAVSVGTTFTSSRIRYEITNIKSGYVKVTGSSSTKLTKAAIPATVSYSGKTYKVTAVGAKAFQKYTKLKTVSIGKNVGTIGKNAFSGCTALKKVTIGAGIKTISEQAFQGDKKLTSVTIKSSKLKTVGSKAFTGVPAKAKVKVPPAKVSAYKKLLQKAGLSTKATVTK